VTSAKTQRRGTQDGKKKHSPFEGFAEWEGLICEFARARGYATLRKKQMEGRKGKRLKSEGNKGRLRSSFARDKSCQERGYLSGLRGETLTHRIGAVERWKQTGRKGNENPQQPYPEAVAGRENHEGGEANGRSTSVVSRTTQTDQSEGRTRMSD